MEENMKKRWITGYIITFMVMGFVFVWGYQQRERNEQYNIYLQNQFQRMFCNMIDDVENIQSNLSKMIVSGTQKQNIMLLADIRRLSYDAQEKLCQLPINHSNVSKTQKFLNQIGDLSTTLSKKNLSGKPLDHKDMNIIENLHNNSNELSSALISLQKDISDHGITIEEFRKVARNELKNENSKLINTHFADIQERVQEYPELIYDGPFSEHLQKRKIDLQGKEIDKDEAKTIAMDFIKNGNTYKVNSITDMKYKNIDGYLVSLNSPNRKEESNITLGITKKKGEIIWMMDTRKTKEVKISKKEAVKAAEKFLKSREFHNMIPTYSVVYDGQILINFAYKEEDVVVYTDLLKVKVALDTGDIVGFEGNGYLINHKQKRDKKVMISKEEAQENISIYAKVLSSRLAIIPTGGDKEVLCYEFKVRYKEDLFLVYINAKTKEEEKILQVLIEDNGILML